MSVSIKLTGRKELFDKLNKDVTKLVNQAQRAAAFQAVTHLAYATPVDQGRARGSWFLSSYQGVFKDASQNGAIVGPALLGPVSTNTVETLYITNGTPYIADLNAGSSLQAPPRFVEKTISNYFETKGNFVQVVRN